ncbi:uncharacterized protein BDZ99DRAFT_566733 [Mytilinidion resinicola]|uniref:F-box domain-containing protein n=1 Tax=Mytilinidion resinicola TaxID=574789 RepID=A0A6A6Z0U7_9PEZI|nr:uncharacterized protein BDZ99DRAFT_566733 [Mytilinidion resinicola]KAF2814792.1 hypothetical protein BDZ99DRAFT_566733 [Mytilinidion resinicola]
MEKYFRLLDLPQELRDRIYYFMLVRDWADTIPESRITHKKYPAIAYQPAELTEETPPGYEAPFLNIFLANRQVYSEASPVFYSSKRFAFNEPPLSLMTAYTWLIGRPEQALENIRSISLTVREFADPSYLPVVRVECHDFWDVLCELLQGLPNFRHLELIIRTVITTVDQQPWDWATDWTVNNWTMDDLKLAQQHKATPSWIYPLFEIQGLETLCLTWVTNVTLIERAMRAAKLIRGSILTNGDTMGKEGIRLRLDHYLSWVNSYHRVKGRTVFLEIKNDRHGKSLLTKLGARRGPKDPWNRGEDADLIPDLEELELDPVEPDPSYTESDCGDRDSLNSVHGFSDDEEDG